MIYLIGGAPRCGKSHLAERVRKYINGQVIAGDAVTAALQKVFTPEWSPDLFVHKVDPLSKMHLASEKIDRLRRRDETAWDFYQAELETAVKNATHDDNLIEGNLWPDFIRTLTLPHKAVFLVDTSPKQATRLIDIRDSDGDNDWMKHYSNEEMVEWAKLNVLRSERYIKLCQKHSYPYFDIAKFGIEDASDEAFHALLSKRGYNNTHKA